MPELEAEPTTDPRLPQKRYFRQRAHVNIFNDIRLDYPIRPSEQDWSPLYPAYFRRAGATAEEESAEAGKPPSLKRPASPPPAAAAPESNTEAARKRGPGDAGPNTNNHPPAKVEFVDIGCGYGGLLVALAPLFPNTLMLGMEIRTKVVDYLQRRVEALRAFQSNLLKAPGSEWVDMSKKMKQELKNLHQSTSDDGLLDNGEVERLVPGHYENIAAMRMNCQKYLPNFFEKGQLSKMFILFADPHFKKRKHKARIVTTSLLSEYAYALRVGGILYTITDVKDLYDWNAKHLDMHPLFERIPDEALEGDPVIPCVCNSTEEGKKVARNNGQKYLACYRRIADPHC